MLLLTLFACTPSGPAGATLGEEAVDLVLIDETGESFRLADERGRVIFLDMSGFH